MRLVNNSAIMELSRRALIGEGTMNFNTLILKKEDHIATLTLNRPDQLNAINRQMADELVVAVAEIANDDARVMVLTGAGQGFCTGGDISEPVAEVYGGSAQNISSTLHRIYQGTILKLYNLDIPTIAMVNGAAIGFGFDLALACDLRIGSENASFMVGFTRLALTPATGGAWLMPRIVGLPKAAELIYTGNFLEAREALRLGILNRLVSSPELEKETTALAQKISQNSQLANRLSKLQLHRGLQTDLETALELGAICQGVCMASADFEEALAALRNKL